MAELYYGSDYSEEEDIDMLIVKERPESDCKYQVLNVDQIQCLMNSYVSEVKAITELPKSLVQSLLNHYNWDQNKLLEQYYDNNRNRLFSGSHIIDSSVQSSYFNKLETKTVTCLICYDNVRAEDITAISCGHEFCVHCWRQYLTTKIIGEGLCYGISCAESRCDILIDENTINTIIKDKEVLKKYQRLVVNAFVDSNPLLRWCPTPDCMTAIKVENYSEFTAIECKCGSVFCFVCGEHWHEPTRCHLLKSWHKKCLGESTERIDSETANWILTNTKECPKCKAPIEKNGGCNHMMCNNHGCGHEFCWICFTDWYRHEDGESCNTYEESGDTQTARARLHRYIHYWTRYQSHQQSLTSEKKLFDGVVAKMDELQLKSMTWIEVQFLNNAYIILCNCRQTLLYTYPFAYYLQSNNQSLIFEANQSNLEVMVEKLSGIMERYLNESQFRPSVDMRPEIINISQFCENRRKVLVNHVFEGYDNESWEFEHLD